jgi:hypothetical protein
MVYYYKYYVFGHYPSSCPFLKLVFLLINQMDQYKIKENNSGSEKLATDRVCSLALLKYIIKEPGVNNSRGIWKKTLGIRA